MHKMQCHSWGSTGRFASFFAFIDELIKDEIKHASDDDFDYTFNITTSVKQTARECIKAEPLTEIVLDNMDVIEMDLDVSEVNLSLPDSDLRSASCCEDGNSNKTLPCAEKKSAINNDNIHEIDNGTSHVCNSHERALCPLCGKEKSYANMPRHLRMVHNTKMDPQLKSSIKATLRGRSHQVRNPQKSPRKMNRHERSVQGSAQGTHKTLCPLCGVEKSSVNMRRHMKNIHKTEIDPKLDASIKASLRGNYQNYNPKKMVCPVCGVEKSANNMRRHMRLVHKTKINQEIATQIRAILRQRSSRVCNEVDRIEQLISDADEDPLKSRSSEPSHEENSTNVGSEEAMSNSMSFKSKSADCKLGYRDLKSTSTSACKKTIKPNDNHHPTHKRCPLCERIILSTSLKRHLSLVHSLSDSQIAEMNLNVRYKCECKKFFRSSCKRHFKVAHNNENQLKQLLVVAGTPEAAAQNENSRSERPVSPEPNEEDNSLERFYAQCTFCSKTILRINLKRHYQSKHSLDESQIMQNLLLIANQNSHKSKCAMCDFFSGSVHALNIHYKKNHSIECSSNAAYTSFADFESHQHNDIYKPRKGRFLCDICQKDFNEKHHIESHMISHFN